MMPLPQPHKMGSEPIYSWHCCHICSSVNTHIESNATHLLREKHRSRSRTVWTDLKSRQWEGRALEYQDWTSKVCVCVNLIVWRRELRKTLCSILFFLSCIDTAPKPKMSGIQFKIFCRIPSNLQIYSTKSKHCVKQSILLSRRWKSQWWLFIRLFPKCFHWTRWIQCLAATAVASWSLTQEVAGSRTFK